jgi:hypothetical protein
MTKQDAKERIYAGVTVGELREVLRNGSRAGMAALNPSITKALAADIFEGALEGRASSDVIKPEAYRRGRYGMSVEALIASNILREFGQA